MASIPLCYFVLLFFVSFISVHMGNFYDNDRLVLDASRVVQLTWSPRVFLHKGFLSTNECDHLISLAKDYMVESLVINSETGEAMFDEIRTSKGYFLRNHQDEIVARIERRIGAWTFLPEENGEGIHILHYELGQKYDPHPDFFIDKFNQGKAGNRVATVIMYLSDVKKGGETVFPDASAGPSQEKDAIYSDCARNGFAVKPQKGDALLFFNFHLNASLDFKSIHKSCPVIEGEKWAATRWIRFKAFGFPSNFNFTNDCDDWNELCSFWSKEGECNTNPGYMIGNDSFPGLCRKSCKVCLS
ncbi:hypothetical protein HPP92_015373 [Vanilla planifolia]|uniref:procollagen-proline 4-dioxygenase n=1 Tax=Vanilla planifolia TaxID=51239 RepID=A0A835UU53_VANPL|nr:hypothetical protein HPP92_015939 [Vanilla planifolia]KAG0475687.1 hypothetical protein HPP92_015373 [Vanilla planifolia]